MINGFTPVNGYDGLVYSHSMNLRGKDMKGLLMVFRGTEPTYMSLLNEIWVSATYTDCAPGMGPDDDILSGLLNEIWAATSHGYGELPKDTEVCSSGPVESWLFDGKNLENRISSAINVGNEEKRNGLYIRFAMLPPAMMPHDGMLTDYYNLTMPFPGRVHSNVIVDSPGYKLPDLDDALNGASMVVGRERLGRKLISEFYDAWDRKSIKGLPDLTEFMRRYEAAQIVKTMMTENLNTLGDAIFMLGE
jgi:hypothetical protein